MAASAFWDAQTSRPNASSFLLVYCEGRRSESSFAVLLVATIRQPGNLEDLSTCSVFSFSPMSPVTTSHLWKSTLAVRTLRFVYSSRFVRGCGFQLLLKLVVPGMSWCCQSAPSNSTFGVGGGMLRLGEKDVAAHKHLSCSASDYLNLPTSASKLSETANRCSGAGALCNDAGESSQSVRSSLITSP